MLQNLLRFSLASVALVFAAASGSSQPAQQQQPYQPQPQPGYQQPPPNNGWGGGGGGGASNVQAGFGGGAQPSCNFGEVQDNEIVGWPVDAGTTSSLAPTFGSQARKHRCNVCNEDGWSVVAACPEGAIVFKQDQSKVLIGCIRVTEQQCRNMFSAIVNEP
jgi:hypothetical protein